MANANRYAVMLPVTSVDTSQEPAESRSESWQLRFSIARRYAVVGPLNAVRTFDDNDWQQT